MVQVDAEANSVTVSKELLECNEMAAITTLDGSIRRWIYARSLPSGVLKEGVYRLPLTLVDEVEVGLKDFGQQRLGLIDAFISVYPAKVEDARIRLRALYDATDYPPAEQIRESFDLQWRYLSLDVPQTISNVLIKQEREKAMQDLTAEVDEIRLALRSSFAELVTHASSALVTAPDGKPKIFRDSLITNMNQFFSYFDARNLTNDKELADLVEKAREAIHGVSPEDLRTDLNVRQFVQKTMIDVKDAIDANVMLKPSRRFTLSPQPVGVS
jgi:hypothetical protein